MSRDHVAEPRVPGHHVGAGPGGDDERVGGQREGGLRVVGGRAAATTARAPPGRVDHLRPRRRLVGQVTGPGAVTSTVLSGLRSSAWKRAGVPQVLLGLELARGLLAVPHPAVPAPAGAGSRARRTRYASSTTNPPSVGSTPRRTVARALAVDVAPGAQRLQGEADRAAGRAAGARRRPRAGPCAIAISRSSDDVADPPAPPGQPVRSRSNRREARVRRGERPVRPFVRGEAYHGARAEGDDRVERGQPEAPGAGVSPEAMRSPW